MLGLSPIGDWSITSSRGVDSFSSKLGNEKSSGGFKNLLGEEVGRGRNRNFGNKHLAVDKDNKTLKRF